MQRVLSLTFIALVLMALTGCKPKVPEGILEADVMENILYDYHLAQGAAEALGENVDENRYLYVQAVFKKYGITEAQFDSSMVFYCGRTEQLKEIYDNLDARLQAEAKSMGVGVSETELNSQFSQTGDTANIWTGPHFILLQNDRFHNITTITLKADSTFREGDYYKLSFKGNYVTNGQRITYVLLQVEYTNGTSTYNMGRANGDYDVSVTLPHNDAQPDLKTSKVTVTFYYQLDRSCPNGYFFITQPSLLRMHYKPVEQDDLDEQDETVTVEPGRADTIPIIAPSMHGSMGGPRISPEEFHESKPVEHNLNIVKERPYVKRVKKRSR